MLQDLEKEATLGALTAQLAKSTVRRAGGLSSHLGNKLTSYAEGTGSITKDIGTGLKAVGDKISNLHSGSFKNGLTAIKNYGKNMANTYRAPAATGKKVGLGNFSRVADYKGPGRQLSLPTPRAQLMLPPPKA